MEFKVIEKNNALAVHCITWSRERAQEWIERYGDSGIFTDKTLRRDSFCIIESREDLKS